MFVKPVFGKPIFFLAVGVLLIALAAAVLPACAGQREPTAVPTAASPEAEPDPPAGSTEAVATPQPTSIPAAAVQTPGAGERAGRAGSPAGGGGSAASLAPFPEPPERDLYHLAVQLKRAKLNEAPRVVNDEPVSYSQGRQDTFWILDLPSLEYYQAAFDLRLVTPHAYWYVEQGNDLRQEVLERSAREFEERVYPGVTSIFGFEWSPGVDNDRHLNILNGRLRGIGGYFSSADEYSLQISPYSNQREIIYMNTNAFPVGTSSYVGVLAHELQHAIHWNADPSEDTWVNEGLADWATAMLGYGNASARTFLRSRPTSMVHWPISGLGSHGNYGAASLFMRYLVEHYGNPEDLRPLINQPQDGIAGVNAYLEERGHDATVEDIFADWTVANFLDEFLPDQDSGLFSYSGLDVGVNRTTTLDAPGTVESEIPQFSTEYIRIIAPAGPVQAVFQSPSQVQLLPVEVGAQGCWWSNVGDSIDSRLTRTLDLSDIRSPTLKYEVWHELETDWDYAYAQVSTDGGETWDLLETARMSPSNPVGNSYGPGYTGNSEGWLSEQIDLAEYSGEIVLFRFQYITDDAINGSGLCLRGFGGNVVKDWRGGWKEGWQADGFVLAANLTPQQFSVRIIQVGAETQVTDMELHSQDTGVLSGVATINKSEESEMVVVAVGATAAKTRQKASYTLTVTPTK